MIIKHPLLTPDLCGLPDIFTVKAPFFVALTKVLTESVPAFADRRASTPGSKPAKLLVIDTFTDIFDHVKDERYEDTTLRARDLRSVSLILHRLASKYRLAVVILGGTRETFPRIDGGDRAPGELRYSDQARWFARAHTVHGEDAHEAILGHVWPNQLNARIMMSRTIRTRPRSVVDPRVQERETKRRKVEGGQQHLPTPTSAETVPFRRFSVIFSSAGPPVSCDYVILDEGVLGIPAEEQPPSTFLYPTLPSASSLPSAPATQSSGFTPRSTAPPSDTAQTQTPRYMQSLSYASGPVSRAPSVPPSQPFATQSSTNTTTTTDTQASISTTASSYANQPTHPPSTAPLSQSVVPSSQPDLDEDWDMYWKDIEGDDQLYVSAEGQTGDVELEEAAEAGPPAEGHDTDSDYYWKDGNENDALYTDL
ncbi:hypothetical protein BN946_scf184798.g11 [Trametes cinnabarina]|uniref:DNA recombination and repair protein Rad51-like C-terminal domain-containing protein n=1 Tax=Pycnoporus cinnabarinus TaxID=5643 RepID=A0A060S8W6_PYCCI|nr:hypothetical protein BN946_scf184798.g11 [Trametes cinnabarina]